MTLSEYFKNNPAETRKDFASRIGVSPTFVTYLAQGRKKPSLDIAQAIERETKGAVKPQDFYNDSQPTASTDMLVASGELYEEVA